MHNPQYNHAFHFCIIRTVCILRFLLCLSCVLIASLADESLTSEAMGLLEVSTKLFENEETVLTSREVERGLAFLDSLTSRTTSKELLTDLETVRKQLEASADKSVGAILEDLSGTSSGAQLRLRLYESELN